MHNVTIL